LDSDGWFPTRDLAWHDSDGYLFIVGRADDTIIRGGENIAPAEIEDTLIRHPSVKDVAVIGIEDEEWGERICAVVVREPNTSPSVDELRSYVRERLRGSRTPDDVVWSTELPHTATGKLLRRELVAQITASSFPANRES
jgi:acyl-CoA synthetase (AMP-forming)/AMP-acid ligase II